MAEQIEVEVPITQNGEWNNIDPKKQLKQEIEFYTKEEDESKEGQVKSLGPQPYIIVEKIYDDIDPARIRQSQYGPSTSVSVIYKDTQVSFFINGDRNIEAWNKCGKAEDQIKLVAKANVDKKGFARRHPQTGQPLMYINFEAVE